MSWVSRDTLLHILGAVVLVAVLTYATTPWWFAAGVNAVLWLGREWAQDVRKGRWPPWPFRPSLHKWIEGGAPALVAVPVALAVAWATGTL